MNYEPINDVWLLQDPVRRPWQQSLLTVLAWLAPHWRVGAAGLLAAQDEELQGVGGAESVAVGTAAAAAGGMARLGGRRLSGGGSFISKGRGHGEQQQQHAEFDASMLYAAAKPSGLEHRLPDPDVPAALIPKLRPYQVRNGWGGGQGGLQRKGPADAVT